MNLKIINLKIKTMDNKDVYILQKDLPDAKVGDEYIFVLPPDYIDGAYYKNGLWDIDDASYWRSDFVENNPTWFKKKEQKIEEPIPDNIPLLIHGITERLGGYVEALKLMMERKRNQPVVEEGKEAIPISPLSTEMSKLNEYLDNINKLHQFVMDELWEKCKPKYKKDVD